MKLLDEMTVQEIRLEIAERKGWKLAKIGDWYAMIDSDGIEHSSTTGISRTMDVAGIPNWPENIAAAWELIEELPLPYEISKVGCFYLAFCGRGDLGSKYMETGTTAPLAICRVWLVWKRGENETHQ